MKISKLFHWLYASLMLLPLMVFGVTGLYYGLNQNAQLSERTEQQPVYYQSNEINTIDDFVVGNIYELNYTSGNITLSDCILLVEKFVILEGSYTGEGYQGNPSSNMPYIQFSTNNYIYTYEKIDNLVYTKYFSTLKCVFVYSQVNNNNLPLSLISETDYQLLSGYLEETYTNDISTSIINAWNSTWQNPLFSWSSESFLIAPFNYITDLFSIPQNNTFSMALSYWLAISIVYLVFDLVMYVPLLAHRWIDKGMVE